MKPPLEDAATMEYTHAQRWIVAHDICDPKRLQRVWRYLHKEGVRLQYSVYLLKGGRAEIELVMQRLRELIDERTDDVRFYPLTDSTRIWGLGSQFDDDGITLCDAMMDKFRQNVVQGTDAVSREAMELRFW